MTTARSRERSDDERSTARSGDQGLSRVARREFGDDGDVGVLVAPPGEPLEETLIGYGSVAVPVRGSDGEVHAAISATLPVGRLHVAGLVPQLRATAVGITRAVERRTGALGPGARQRA